MGAWGAGILQNDSAQDSLVAASHVIVESLRELADSQNEGDWARVYAAVGLLMRFSPYSLAADNDESEVVRRAIERHRAGGAAGPELDAALDAIVAGERPDYRMSTLVPELAKALHGAADRGFPMQKTWADAPARCFEFAESKAYLQEFANGCAERIDEEFGDEEALADLCRESCVMGDFALLLILDGIHVDPARFERWRAAWRAGREHDEEESEFFERYCEHVEAAFDYAIARFQSRP